MGNPGNVRWREPLCHALGLKALVHLDEGPKVFVVVFTNPEYSSLAGSHLRGLEYNFWGARHTRLRDAQARLRPWPHLQSNISGVARETACHWHPARIATFLYSRSVSFDL